MRDRQGAWKDPKVRELAKQFVPATDEVWRLHNRKDPDCTLFQKFAWEGHYKGRPRNSTLQGIYCASPSGVFLASTNHRDPRRMEAMMQEALRKWRTLSKKERLLDDDPQARWSEIDHPGRKFPKDGLILRVTTRDLFRNAGNDWRSEAWNIDFHWLKAEEGRSILPRALDRGAERDWPEALIRRMVRLNLVDNVRGQTDHYSDKQVVEARLKTRVESVRRGVATLRFEGKARCTTASEWPEEGKCDVSTRGIEATLLGEALYDTRKREFTKLEIVAAGSRWGRTRYNFRQDDVDPAPIGWVFELVENSPENQIAPAALWEYRW